MTSRHFLPTLLSQNTRTDKRKAWAEKEERNGFQLNFYRNP